MGTVRRKNVRKLGTEEGTKDVENVKRKKNKVLMSHCMTSHDIT